MKTLMKSIVLAVILLVAVNGAVAQVTVQKTAADLFKALKVGQWAELEGTIQADFSFTAKKVKLLTGDFQDDDWEVKGVVKAVNPAKKQFSLFRLPVIVTAESEYESPDGTFKAFDDVKVGMLLECEGTYLKDGTFSAEETQHETEFKPNQLNEMRAVGKIEKLDPVKRTVTMMGMTFRIVDATKLQSAVK